MIRTPWLLEIAGWKTFDLGKKLFQSGLAGETQFQNGLLTGIVIDQGKKWKARLKISSDFKEAANLCNCPESRNTGLLCPHVIAIGLQYEKLQSFRDSTTASEPPTSSPPPSPKPKPTSEIHSTLEFHLPDSFPQLDPHIGLNVSLFRKNIYDATRHPWSKKDRDLISEEDQEEIDWIQRFTNTSNPSHAHIPFSHLNSFLRRCTESRRLFFQEKEVGFDSLNNIYELNGTIQKEGSLLLQFDFLKKIKPTFTFKNDSWLWENQTLFSYPTLPEKYLKNIGKPQLLKPLEVASLIQNDLPPLESILLNHLSLEKYQWKIMTPQIHIHIEGGFRGIQIQSTIHYETLRFPTRESLLQLSSQNTWIPHPQHPLEFIQREIPFEIAWLKQLLLLQFNPSRLNPEDWICHDPRGIERILSQELPEWRKKYQVTLGEKIQKLLETVELISPEMTIFPDQNGWLSVEIQFQDSTGKNKLTSLEIQQLLQKRESSVYLKNGRRALIPLKLIEQFQETIHDCQVESNSNGFRIRKEHAATLSAVIQKNDWKLSTRSVWTPPPKLEELNPITLTPSFQNRLRPYQTQGVQWFDYLRSNQFGGILADEMGLGKTVQTLAYLDFHYHHHPKSAPTLIVAPTSLLWNWKSECEQFAPHLEVLVIQGEDRGPLFAQIPTYSLVLTSYALLRRDLEHYQKIAFSYLFLDEAQHIKNKQSQNAQAAKGIQATHRFVLTGTPMENSVADLWSIFDFLMPGYLGNAREFKERYETPIIKHEDSSVLHRLRYRVSPFILRRTKKEVAPELPDRIEQTLFCDMTVEQAQVYQSLLEESRRQVEETISKHGEEKSRFAIFSALTRLRQAACHLQLLPQLKNRTWKSPSSKFDLVHELLQESYDAQHRVLVFSQFVQLLQILRKELNEEKTPYCYLDGQSVDRQEQVQQFQNSPNIPVFLISLKAGGTGLNLTGADTVIILDPWWNPAIEDQAIARAHRIGQKQTVTSFKIIARGTVEEKILQLQKRKKEWIQQTLTDDNAILKTLNLQEIRSLLD